MTLAATLAVTLTASVVMPTQIAAGRSATLNASSDVVTITSRHRRRDLVPSGSGQSASTATRT